MTFNKLHWLIGWMLVCLAAIPFTVLAEDEDPDVILRWTLVDWLDCTDCEDGELEAVVALGEAAVPSLSATLEIGPSPLSTERLRLHLIETHRAMVSYAETHPEAAVTMSEQDYVNTYLDNHRMRHQKRAAEALGKIGGGKAKRVLAATARLDDLRHEVRIAVEAALSK